MTRKRDVLEVRASGSYGTMGARVGRECAEISRSMLSCAKATLSAKGISWEAAVERSALYFPYAESHDPNYVDYVRGYARGSEQRFEDLFVLLSQEEKGLCTDVAVNMRATADGSVMSAHTEDWRPENEKHVVLLNSEPRNRPSSMLMTLGGLELIGGLNSSGISFTGNSLYQNDSRVGIPKIFLANRIASSRTLSEAISAALAPERGSSYNTNLCHPSGEMYCVEASATDSALIYPQGGCLVHTNHYIHPRMAKYESLFSHGSGEVYMPFGSSTLVRCNRALRLIRPKLGSVTRETLTSILSDHVNFPDSICAHTRKGVAHLDQGKTIYATIADVTNKSLWVCIGEPCKGRFVKHSLD